MSQQSESDELVILLLLIGSVAAAIAAAFLVGLAFSAVAAWLGFTIKYPRQSIQFSTWVLLGLSIIAGFGVLWHYVWLWDIPPFRAWAIASLVMVIPALGLYFFINVPTGDNKYLRSMKMTVPLLALGAFGYWIFNGAGAVYEAVYCHGPLAGAMAADPLYYSGTFDERQLAFPGGDAYSDTFGSRCGEKIAEHWKTGFYFSCFWALSALYFPFGLIHSWITKKRKYTLNDIFDAWDDLTGVKRPVSQTKPVQQPSNQTATSTATAEPSGYQAPPFRGR